MSRILVIDDEQGIREVLSGILEDEGYQIFSAEDGIEGLRLLKTEPIDVVLLDVWLPNMGGIDVLKQIKATYPETQVIIISGHGNIDLAVKAVKLGAFDFMEKPLSLERVVTLVRNALEMEQLKKENRRLRSTFLDDDEILGESEGMRRVRGIIQQSAASDSRILISGENGTGKELVAREIHRRSRRAGEPFVEVNCAAIPDTLIESELFGHEKGAFTSAVGRRRGKFEMADRGTLFLDEVADMSLSAQAKVLRAIQEMKFERVGGEQSLSVDVRLIAATNKDIQHEIAEGRFREDLFFRLNVIPIHVPPLRERSGDLPILIDFFMKKFRPSPEAALKTVDAEAMQLLQEYDWPGNVRELKNFIERVNIMTDEEVLTAELIRFFLGEPTPRRRVDDMHEYGEMGLNEARDSFEKRYIMQKLQEHGNNISRTAEALGVYPSNLHGKIRKFGIKIEK